MAVKIVKVGIKGKSPLLMHRYPLEPVDGFEKKRPAEQAEISAYRDAETEELYLPGPAVQRALVAGAAYSKGKGRASLQKPAAACLLVSPDRLSLGKKEYEIDSRAVVMPTTKGRIVRHRPRLNSWAVEFALEYDDVLLKETEARQIVDDTGTRVGLLDYRPACKGPFGRFNVVLWELQ